ncbi:xaa-Pro aminopeptidase [Anopheles sinensis]|uniref:Xaa-Pro aminopeptidase n=1 Tax=Anopheles sinensis TaxID=74873 RepID=A0A084VP15_ANOSI|nr:xaa-Pro aminopeptidase [Anopheles sinensis]
MGLHRFKTLEDGCTVSLGNWGMQGGTALVCSFAVAGRSWATASSTPRLEGSASTIRGINGHWKAPVRLVVCKDCARSSIDYFLNIVWEASNGGLDFLQDRIDTTEALPQHLGPSLAHPLPDPLPGRSINGEG